MVSEKPNAAGEAGNQEPRLRGRSTIEFPYTDLEDSEAVVQAVRDVGGTACEWNQLAAKMGQAPQGGGFRLRVMGARTYGLLSYERNQITLSDLGLHIIDPKHVRKARVDSFLRVPLFKAVFDKVNGQLLPPPPAIERMMGQLGVAPKQTDKARQVFIRSAKRAGFFDLSADRLVQPNTGGGSLPSGAPPNDPAQPIKPNNVGGGGGGNGVPPVDIPEAILGLLRGLPASGSSMTKRRKDSLVAALTAAINFIYPDQEDLQ